MISPGNDGLCDRRVEFENVVARYSPALLGVALRRLRNVEDAEDAVQDALLAACRHIGQFEGRSQMSSWLTRIVINAAGMRFRSRWSKQVVSLDETAEDGSRALANELRDARPNPERICQQTEYEEMLERALAQISPKLRDAFRIREMAGLSTREAADALKITRNTLRSRVSRARIAVSLYIEKFSGMRTLRTRRKRLDYKS